MKKLIFYLVAVLLLSSCATQKKCDCKFPCTVKDSTAVVTRTEVIYRDTTIYIYLPGKTVRDTLKVYVDANGIMHSDKSYLFTSFAESWAWVENGRLMHELIQKDTTLARVIRNALRDSQSVTETVKIRTVVQEVNRLTGWQWFQIWAGRIVAVVFLLMVGWKRIMQLLKLP